MISPWRDGSIHETSKRIRAGTVSPVTIVDACLQRIDHLNPTLNAFATIVPDEARAQARHAEAEINGGRWIGPLHGIPVGIKDFYDTAGVRTTAAARQFLTNIKPTQSVRTAFDAAVERLRALGYTLRTTTAPFDNPGFDVRNIDADRKAIAARSFREIDVLVLPTTNGGIPTVRQAQHDPLALSAENTMFANYFGLPAISVPSGLDAKGLPLGLQIVGRPWEDGTVLDLANTFLTRAM